MMKMPKKSEYIGFKNYERKVKYQKHVNCSKGYKSQFVDDKFSKPCKSYLGEDTVYNFINSILGESKYCSSVTKKHINNELVMTKKDYEDYETLRSVAFIIMILFMVVLK